jgi:putative oxidoreductase
MSRLLNWPGHGWLAVPARWYLGFVFLLACQHKIAHPGAFALDVATYGILPLSLVNLMAVTLPWLELSAGIMLAVGLRARAAALMVFGMMVMFTVALAIALAQGLDMACGCFASEAAEEAISGNTVLRDLGWLSLSVYVVLFDRSPIGFDRILARRKAVSGLE